MNTKNITISLMMAGLLAMVATAGVYHYNKLNPPQSSAPSMEQMLAMQESQNNQSAQMPPQGMGSDSGMSAPMNMSSLFSAENPDPALVEQAASLMMSMQEDPNNVETLLALSMTFYQANDFLAMLNFANRAAVLAPANELAPYYAGIAYSQLGENENAVMSFERSLANNNSPETRYNLAILYIYNLDDSESAKIHLEQALQSPNLDPALKELIEAELLKL